MANYTLVHGELVNADELMHYGVIGMKWGVRRGKADKAYTKASKKLKKIENKVEKSKKKADKAYDQYVKYAGRTGLLRASKAASKKQAKYRTQASKYQHSMNKAIKWIQKMDKTFANTNVKLSKQQVALGKEYANRITTMRQIAFAK